MVTKIVTSARVTSCLFSSIITEASVENPFIIFPSKSLTLPIFSIFQECFFLISQWSDGTYTLFLFENFSILFSCKAFDTFSSFKTSFNELSNKVLFLSYSFLSLLILCIFSVLYSTIFFY